MTLRDGLAAAIASFAGDGSETVILDVDREEADAILSDAAFCIALTEAVESALANEDWSDAGWSTADDWDDLAAAIVARMLAAPRESD